MWFPVQKPGETFLIFEKRENEPLPKSFIFAGFIFFDVLNTIIPKKWIFFFHASTLSFMGIRLFAIKDEAVCVFFPFGRCILEKLTEVCYKKCKDRFPFALAQTVDSLICTYLYEIGSYLKKRFVGCNLD